jgi:hypothetical protein
MKSTVNFLGLAAGFAVLSMFGACSSGSGTAANEGGAGNTTETGGAAAATGGGSAGGNGSTGGSSSASPTITTLFNFSTDVQNFKLDSTPGSSPYVNLAAPDAGAATLTWASKDYDGSAVIPNAGSLMITATFTNWNQFVVVTVPFPTDNIGNPIPLKDPITGKYKTIKARVEITSGLSPNLNQFPGGAILYLQTDNTYNWGESTWANVSSTNSWMTLSFDAGAPGTGTVAAFVATDPMGTLGIKISSNGGGTTPPAFGAAQNTVIYIDQITIEDDP